MEVLQVKTPFFRLAIEASESERALSVVLDLGLSLVLLLCMSGFVTIIDLLKKKISR